MVVDQLDSGTEGDGLMDKNVEQNKLLLDRAGLSYQSTQSQSEEHENFDRLVQTISEIHGAKATQYGDYITTHGDESPQFFAVQHFCDIKRKYVRAKNFIDKLTQGQKLDYADLLDTYSDLAVYAVMGLQMAFHCMEKSKEPPKVFKHTYTYEIKSVGIPYPFGASSPNQCIHGINLSAKCAFCKDDIPF